MREEKLTIEERYQLENFQLKAQLLMTQMALLERERDLAISAICARYNAGQDVKFDLERGMLVISEGVKNHLDS